MSQKCYLENMKTLNRLMVPLTQSITIGRDRATLLEDLSVSRKQLEISLDAPEKKLLVKQVGKAVSGINGFALVPGKLYYVKHDDIIEVKIGHHQFKVNFESEDTLECTKNKKAKLDYPIFQQNSNSTILMASKNDSSSVNKKDLWENIDGNELLIFTPEGCVARRKVAAFDVDGTIIKTKSGARFPTNPEDWQFYLGNTKTKLQKLHAEGFKIVFFTNQGGVGKNSGQIAGFKGKIEKIVKAIAVPIQVFIALGKVYRKPMPAMWQTFVNDKNDGVKVELKDSIFVGDAAGRDKNWAPKKNKDHSCADRLFALNIGIAFKTPEEFFANSPRVPHKMPEFDPRNYNPPISYPDIKYDKQHVIVMVGGPGSGKSHFCQKFLIPKGYGYVNRDKLGSWQKCVKLVEEYVQSKRNVVVDNTNGDIESRKRYIDVAKKFGVDIRCFVMEATKTQAQHNNKFRELTDSSHMPISDIIIHSYWKNFKEPAMTEGYADIVKIPLIPYFEDKESENMYRMFLIDK